MARITDIVSAAAEITGLTVADIMGQSRLARVTRIRGACWLISFEGGRSYTAIGKAFGRDHSTVIYGCSKAVMLGHSDPKFAAFLDELRTHSEAYSMRMRDRLKAIVASKPAPAPPVILTPAPASQPIQRSIKPKNDFRAESDADISHREADAVARGSLALLAALRAAQSNIGKAA